MASESPAGPWHWPQWFSFVPSFVSLSSLLIAFSSSSTAPLTRILHRALREVFLKASLSKFPTCLKPFDGTRVFIAALFPVAKRGKQPKHQSIDEWIHRTWCTHTMEYHSALKRNEIPTHATTWMKLEDTRLSEISQLQKDRSYRIPLT